MKRDDWMTLEQDIYKSKPREMKQNEKQKLLVEAQRQERESQKQVKIVDNKTFEFGDKGSKWRMMKLSKVEEISREEGRSLEDVAMERYGSLEDYNEALKEQEYLKRTSANHNGFNKNSESKPTIVKEKEFFGDRKFKQPVNVERNRKELPSKIKDEPIVQSTPRYTLKEEREPILTRDELNLLQAQILKAKFKNSKNLQDLQQEYEFQLSRFEKNEQFNRKQPLKQPQQRLEPLAKKEDSEKTLQELLKEEKTSKTSMNDLFAKNIANDKSFENDDDYMDNQSTNLASKKQYEERDYKKQRREYNLQQKLKNDLGACEYCIQEGMLSKLSIISQGTRVYLALPKTISMVNLHCLIIPKSHEVSTLDLDDDDWTEIRNFQKCITRMYDSVGMLPIFIEQTVDNKHTYIECFALKNTIHEDCYQWFKVKLLIRKHWNKQKETGHNTNQS